MGYLIRLSLYSIVCFTLLLLPSLSWAEGTEGYSFTGSLKKDFRLQATTPLKYTKEHPVKAGLIVTGIVGLILIDRDTRKMLLPGEGDENIITADDYKLPRDLSKYGRVPYAIPLLAGIGLYGYMGDSQHERDTFLLSTEALITTGAWTMGFKKLFSRERPHETEDDVSDFKGPGELFSDEHLSFPSGHSSMAFALATVMSHQYPDHYIVPVVSYSLASAIAYSRVVLDKHWPSDVIAGSLLGYYCARQVIKRHEDDGKQAQGGARLEYVGPVVSNNFSGVMVSVGF